MYINLKTISKINAQEGGDYVFKKDIIRYIEFEKVAVFLLDAKLDKDTIIYRNSNSKIVSLIFSQEGGVNHLKIAWEFQVIDGLGEIYEIVEMDRKIFEEKEVIYCRGWGFDIGYYLDPDTGDVLHKEPTR